MRKGLLTRITAAFLCVVFALSFGGCNIADQIRSSLHERIVIQNPVSIQELTRLLVSSINDKRKTTEAFSEIPSDQLDGLSYSYFYEYLNILRTVSSQDNKGKVVSFRIMGDDECRNLLGRDVSSAYGQINGAELLYSTESDYPVYIFFSVNEDGIPYLSSGWVTSILNIYNYSNHYFTLLDSQNADAVKALLAPGLIGEEYTDEVIYTKAMQLCEFYRLRVMSNQSEYEITRLVPWEMTIRIPETIAADGNLFEDHIVSITLRDNGNYFIDDKISAAPDVNLLYLVRGDERLIRVGNEYTFTDLTGILGEPSTYSYNQMDNVMIVIYSGVILRFDDIEIDATEMAGTLSSIRLMSNSTYTVGYNLYSGMTRSQILLSYPFADDSDYTIRVGEYEVQFGFDDEDYVSYVKICA